MSTITSPPRPTPPLPPAPLSEDAWMTEVVPRLPANLDAAAHTYGALRRKRKVACASDLLRGLLAYVLCTQSFRLLGAWAVILGLADLSEAAWRKRLRAANRWLLWVLTQLCGCSPSHAHYRMPTHPPRVTH